MTLQTGMILREAGHRSDRSMNETPHDHLLIHEHYEKVEKKNTGHNCRRTYIFLAVQFINDSFRFNMVIQ